MPPSRIHLFFILSMLLLSLNAVLGQNYYLKVEYPISPGFYFAEVNGVKIYNPSQAIYVNPGDNIEGFFDVKVVNVRGGPWITPVIGTASWTRGWYACITSDAPDGESIQSFHFSLKAPDEPGTYYIGVFAGWMYFCAEVASNDHPPQFGDGDDVWDMSQSDWESMISSGKASAIYGQPGRAIRIVVQGAQPPAVSIDVWTDKGGRGTDPDGGFYNIGDDITIYCSIDRDVDFLKVWIEKPDGTSATLYSGSAKAGTYRFPGKVGEPAGERRVKALAYLANKTFSDEVRFYASGVAKLEISHNFPTQWNVGDVRAVTVTVRNTGGSGATNVRSGIGWTPDDAFRGEGCSGQSEASRLGPGEQISFTCNIRAMRAGTHSVEISAVADGGISASVKLSVTVKQAQDTTPPKVRVIAPNGGEKLYPGETFRIKWEASDNVGVAKIHIWLFDGGKQVAVIAANLENGGYYDWVVQDRPGTNYKVRIAAVDAAGNAGYDESDAPFTVVVKGGPSPNQPPTAYIDSISPNPAAKGETVYFTGHGYDPDGSIVAYEWRSSIDGFLSSSNSFTTSKLSVGTHTIYFRVEDDKGVWSSVATATLEIKQEKPPTVEVYIEVGENLKTGGTGYVPHWRIGLETDSPEYSLTREKHTLHVSICENRNIEPKVSGSYIIDLTNYPGESLTITINYNEEKNAIYLTFDPPTLSVSEQDPQDIEVSVNGPYESWLDMNFLRSLFGWGRIYRYSVSVKNNGANLVVITGLFTYLDKMDSFKNVDYKLLRAPRLEGELYNYYQKIAKIALGQGAYGIQSALANVVKAAYLGGPEGAFLASYVTNLPSKLADLVEETRQKEKIPSATGGFYGNIPIVEVRPYFINIIMYVPPMLKPGQEAQFEVIFEESSSRSAQGTTPVFQISFFSAKRRVDLMGSWDIMEHYANLMLSKQYMDFKLANKTIRGGTIP